jgi:hypothetical protein
LLKAAVAEKRLLGEPSKRSKAGFEGFDGDPGGASRDRCCARLDLIAGSHQAGDDRSTPQAGAEPREPYGAISGSENFPKI